MKTCALNLWCVFVCVSCASPGTKTLLGGLIGSAAGIAVGAAMGAKRAQTGYLVTGTGGAVGAGVGYLLDQPKQSFEIETKEMRQTMAPFSPVPTTPTLLPPVLDSYYVDDQIRSNTFVPGHMEYKIKENAKWSR